MIITRQRGKVLFISSKAGVSPSAGLAVHSGTKHMLEAVAKALRQELRGTGVRQEANFVLASMTIFFLIFPVAGECKCV